jgi:transposase
MTHLPPSRSLFTTPPPRTLADAVTQVRHPRNHATAQLTPHRDELLKLRAAGESIETLALALRAFDVAIGKETLRRWFASELGHKPAKRRKTPAKPATGQPAAANASTTPGSVDTISTPTT